jgi:hypothetical protein
MRAVLLNIAHKDTSHEDSCPRTPHREAGLFQILLQKRNNYLNGGYRADLQSKSRRTSYFCRFVYWIKPVFVGGVENCEDAGIGSGFCFLGFLASRLRLI